MNFPKIIEQLEDIITELKDETKLQLEDHNFRIDSVDWKKYVKDDIEYLQNPQGDVWEYINLKDYPELNGEQLFTWDAAMRETKKAGKRLPTDEEFEELLKTKDDMKNVVFAGYRYADGSFNNLGSSGYFWSSLESGSSAWRWGLDSSSATVSRYTSTKAYGFSARCIKN